MIEFFSNLKPTETIAICASLLAFFGVVWSNINSARAVRIVSKHKMAEFNNQQYQQLKLEFAELVSLAFERGLGSTQFDLVQVRISQLAAEGDPTLNEKKLSSLRVQAHDLATKGIDQLSKTIRSVEKIKLALDESVHSAEIEQLNEMRVGGHNWTEKTISDLAQKILKSERNKLAKLLA